MEEKEEVALEETKATVNQDNRKDIYVLDTNVFLVDCAAMYSFGKAEVVIPMTVLEEIDKFKNYEGIAGANARKTARELNKLFKRNNFNVTRGVSLPGGGRLKVKTTVDSSKLPKTLDKNKNDNKIMLTALIMSKTIKGRLVVLVTNDITMAVKAASLGVETQEYIVPVRNTIELESTGSYCGQRSLIVDDEVVENVNGDKQTFLKEATDLHLNEFLILRSNINNKKTALVRYTGPAKPLRKIFTSKQVSFLGVTPRNKEQRLCVDLLTDSSVEMVTVTGTAGSGKAQPLDSMVLTPEGFKRMGNLVVGDCVIDPTTGLDTKVVGIYPQGVQDIYEIEFSDGSKAESTLDHLWLTKRRVDRKARTKKEYKVRTLGEIRDSLLSKDNRLNHSVPLTKPVSFSRKETLLIDPYILGLFLGDGSLSNMHFSTGDRELVSAFANYLDTKYNGELSISHYRRYDYSIKNVVKNSSNFFSRDLRLLGLDETKNSETKFIPKQYLYSSIDDRISLLQGLMDTDGSIEKNGTIRYSSNSQDLIESLLFIVNSLGGYGKKSSSVKSGKVHYRLRFYIPGVCPFRLKRKVSRYDNLDLSGKNTYRLIKSISFSRKAECQCIKVDSDSKLYLTDGFVVTHNTLLALATGLYQVLERNQYSKLVIFRPVIPFGNDIGYLPGSMEDKLKHWLDPIWDNIYELLSNGNKSGRNTKKVSEQIEELIEQNYLEVGALTYIKGRSLKNSFIIVDEAEDLTSSEIKMISTRVGEGSKIVFTGDITQIDNPKLNAYDCGISKAINALIDEPSVGHITLPVSERSSLAGLVAKKL